MDYTTPSLASDRELAARLRQLDMAELHAPGFDYSGLLERQAAARRRARQRRTWARGTASALVLAMVFGSVWRFTGGEPEADLGLTELPSRAEQPSQPRMVRADTYLALAALEDHIATIDDALNDARLLAPRGAEVARLERTRDELMDSYVQVRYAEMVSNSF